MGERFEFADGEAMEYFQMHMGRYYEKLVDYLLTNRAVVRILMFESSRSGKHKSILFRLMKLMYKDPSNPMYRTLLCSDEDFD